MPFETIPPETWDLRDRAVALYGRFSPGVRERLVVQIVRGGGHVARDLTRGSHLLVVGALATTLIDSGALSARLRSAAERGVPVKGERAFATGLAGEEPAAATLPMPTALAQIPLTRDDADVLAAFDLIVIERDNCRFGDAATLRTAGELLSRGRSLADAVRILTRARDLAPLGRHRVVLTGSGEAALQWQDGLTTLEGQGYFPLDEDHATIEDLFEGAALAEANGELDDAVRLYDMCGRADRSDAIAPYNLGNIRLAQGFHDQAVLAYQQALARDAGFVEARYNLAQALEAAGKAAAARTELGRVLDADPDHADALFNLAQLRMKVGEMGSAKALYERYLALDPPDDWAATARKAILYCAASLRA
jgi:tetratricopeptide (TPR) repeat protein